MGKVKRKRKGSKHKKTKSLFVKALFAKDFESRNKKDSIKKKCSQSQVSEVPSPFGMTVKKAKRIHTGTIKIDDAVSEDAYKDSSRHDKFKSGVDKSMTLSIDSKSSDTDTGAIFRQTLRKGCAKKRSLREKLQNKLESGRFRYINEKLYSINSLSAFKLFKSEPELFDAYHEGFSSQVQKWPVNPVDTMIDWILQR